MLLHGWLQSLPLNSPRIIRKTPRPLTGPMIPSPSLPKRSHCPLTSYFYVVVVMTLRGIRVIFHSALSFILSPTSILFIWTASVIWRSMASFLYVPVTDIKNACSSPPCCSTQCRHSGELLKSLAANLPRCS